MKSTAQKQYARLTDQVKGLNELAARIRVRIMTIGPMDFRDPLEALEWCESEVERTLATVLDSVPTVVEPDPEAVTGDLPTDYHQQFFHESTS